MRQLQPNEESCGLFFGFVIKMIKFSSLLKQHKTKIFLNLRFLKHVLGTNSCCLLNRLINLICRDKITTIRGVDFIILQLFQKAFIH